MGCRRVESSSREKMIGKILAGFQGEEPGAGWQMPVGRWTCQRSVNDSKCDEGGMQFLPGVEMVRLLTGESVCPCNGARGGGWPSF